MNQKLNLPANLSVKQDGWGVSPCSDCDNTPCCKNLPLDILKLQNYSDMVNLQLSSVFRDIYLVLKKSGEWNLYLRRNCLFVDADSGKCLIHAMPNQSLICKSYDAHRCWYKEAFKAHSSTLIKFTGGMLDDFEHSLTCANGKFDCESYDFDTLRSTITDDFNKPVSQRRNSKRDYRQYTLSYKKAYDPDFLFLPPYIKPSSINHLELAEFRLGFPGVYLAVADNCWAYLIKTSLDLKRLQIIRKNLPSVAPQDFSYSFKSFQRNSQPFSEIGEKFVVLRKDNLPLLKSMVKTDAAGRIKRLPTTYEIYFALKKDRPERAA